MKFTKEEVYEELVKKMTSRGEKLNLTERTLKGQIEALMKLSANDETELTAFIDAVLPSMKELDGQYRKDNSDFIKDWNDKHKANTNGEGNKQVVNEGDKKVNTNNPEIESLLKKMESLEQRLAAEDEAKSLKQKRVELEGAMEKKGIKDKEWTKDFLDQINISKDMDIETKADAFLKIYNKSKAIVNPDATPLSSSTSGNDNNKARFDYIKKEYETEQARLKN